TCPNVALFTLKSGALKIGVFVELNASARNSMRFDSRIGNDFCNDRSRFRNPGPRTTPTPSEPNTPALGWRNAAVLNQVAFGPTPSVPCGSAIRSALGLLDCVPERSSAEIVSGKPVRRLSTPLNRQVPAILSSTLFQFAPTARPRPNGRSYTPVNEKMWVA